MRITTVTIMLFGLNAILAQVEPGSVFVSTEYESGESESLYPTRGLRIDKFQSDTLYIKYMVGEAFMDIDFVYESSCECYKSKDLFLFSPYGKDREEVDLRILNSSKLLLEYFRESELVKSTYRLSYIDNVNLETHRNPYYAEDGFALFKK